MNAKQLFSGLLTATVVLVPFATLNPASAMPKTVQGGHSKGKSPSSLEKHQNGEATRNEQQNVNPRWNAYKKNGGKLAKAAWKKQGMPTK
jgi:hypothetical protein